MTKRLAFITVSFATAVVFLGAFAEASAVPSASRVVAFQVTGPEGLPVTLLAQEGTTSTIQGDHGRYMFAFMPEVTDEKGEAVRFTVFQVTRNNNGQKEMKQVDRVEANAQVPGLTSSLPSFKLEIVGVFGSSATNQCGPARSSERTRVSEALTDGLQRQSDGQESAAGGQCHVSCNGISIWACAGDTGTGCSCCTDPCCGILQ